jgi:capsular exopolysaccharide synthesis family protein
MTHHGLTLSARPADALVSFVAPASLEADQYRSLRHLVERLNRDSSSRVFAVTSPGTGEGKSVTTLNLAGSLAQSRDARVLVIDADLHRPTVAEYLGIVQPPSTGLVDLLAKDDQALDHGVCRLDALNLWVLLTGAYEKEAYELLNSRRLDALIQEARQRFDYVLIDTPPVTPLPDCRLIGRCVDGFFLVVAAHRTPRKAFAEALNLMDPAKLIGTVFNGDDRPLARYSSYYAYSQPAAALRRDGQAAWWRRPFTPKRSHQSDDVNH